MDDVTFFDVCRGQIFDMYNHIHLYVYHKKIEIVVSLTYLQPQNILEEVKIDIYNQYCVYVDRPLASLPPRRPTWTF